MTELPPQLQLALGTLSITQRIVGPRGNWHFKKMDLSAFTPTQPSTAPGELGGGGEENAEKQLSDCWGGAFSALQGMPARHTYRMEGTNAN